MPGPPSLTELGNSEGADAPTVMPARDEAEETTSQAVRASSETHDEPDSSRRSRFDIRRLSHRLSLAIRSRSTPAFLVSLILHIILMLVLALWISGQGSNTEPGFEVVLEAANLPTTEPPKLQLAAGDDAPPPAEPTESIPQPSTSTAGGTPLADLLQVTPAPRAQVSGAVSQLERTLNATRNSPSASFAAISIDGRSAKNRSTLAQKNGGTLESEQAVEDALEWLAEHQRPNGSWSLVHDGGKCKGRCGNVGTDARFDTAATGLSLLAFLGAGYTHHDGKHSQTIQRGLYFLMQAMESTPQGGSFLYQSERGMYNHGIAAFAVCEAYQLTGDADLKSVAEKATKFISSAQGYNGGWGYLPKKPGDLTLTGWQVMALKSAHGAKLEIPPTTILGIDPFLDSQMSESKVTYGYREPGNSPTCTAIGMLLRMFRGMSHTDPRLLEGADFLSRRGPSKDDVYYNYYTTLTLFHIGGGFWEDWNPRVRDYLVATQAKDGHEAGSWYFDNPYGKEGGRLYTTAMAAMTLEVYYRYSPLYQQTEAPFEL